MEQLPKIVRQRLQATAEARVHPDPDLLNAFAERLLRGRERAQVLDHLAQCGECREVIAMAVPEFESAQARAGLSRSSWLPWPVLRWGAVAACVVVVGTAITLHYDKPQTRPSVAAMQAPPAADEMKSAPAGTEGFRSSRDQGTARFYEAGPQSKSQATADSHLAKQLDEPAQMAGRAVASPAAPARANDKPSEALLDLAAANSVPASAAPPAAKIAELDQKAEERNEKMDSYSASSTDQVATLEARSAPATLGKIAEAAPAKAKDDARKKLPDSNGGLAAGALMIARHPEPENNLRSREGAKLVPRWTLTPDGTLRRSLDAGKSWQAIPVNDQADFRAVAAMGSEIWVGGSSGALYHSSDAGEHWVPVKPAAAGQSLSGDIIAIEFTDAQHGKVSTAAGETWTTADAGQSWQTK